VLAAAAGIVTTSQWARQTLLGLYGLAHERVHAVPPGVDRAEAAPGSAGGGALLCVAAVIPGKGHDVLLDALATLGSRAWHCLCVGSLERDAVFAAEMRGRATERGLGDRVRFAGPRSGAELDRCYENADLLVLASRGETYGMVVTEALAHGLPVVATDAGGLSEALGHGAGSARPGLLVPPDDPAALGAALRAWLDDPGLRRTLRQAARERRATLAGWSATASAMAGVLAGCAGR
jgi:glycosyltransferase involved in cell wall biosynthesis